MTRRCLASAPRVCRTRAEIDEAAAAASLPVAIVEALPAGDSAKLVDALTRMSGAGGWAVVDIRDGAGNLTWLRAAIQAVWLRCTWDHHPGFRFWVVVNPDPATFRLSTLRDEALQHALRTTGGRPIQPYDTLASAALLQAWADDRAAFLLAASAVVRRYCASWANEALARDLVAAVADAQYYQAREARGALRLLDSADVVALFDACPREDLALALVERVEGDKGMCGVDLPESDRDPAAMAAANARDVDGRSVIDAMADKIYTDAAVAARNAGCRSERFDFGRLLDPAYRDFVDALLDPERPFPFDAVESGAVLAGAAQRKELRRMFDCRVDVAFNATDYPLAAACCSGDMETVHIVLDRMCQTGVSPWLDDRVAADAIRAILDENAADVGREMAEDANASGDAAAAAAAAEISAAAASAAAGEGETRPMSPGSAPHMSVPNEALVYVVHRLCRTLRADEVRTHITVPSLLPLRGDRELMAAVLHVLDPALERDPQSLLKFFIDYDPANAAAEEVVGLAVDALAAGPDPERVVFRFVSRMVSRGPPAATMTGWAITAARARRCLPMSKRCDGVTPVMLCLALPPNVDALVAMLAPLNDVERQDAVSQEDAEGSTPLQRLAVAATNDPEGHSRYGTAIAACARVLLNSGASPAARAPRFPASLFVMAARAEVGELAAELLAEHEHRVASVVLETALNVRALVARHAITRWGEFRVSGEVRCALMRPDIGLGPPRPLPPPVVWELVAQFAGPEAAARLGQTAVALHLATLADGAWIGALDDEHIDLVGPRLSSREAYQRQRLM